jgi:excinuclease UvrABC ATPase subunit
MQTISSTGGTALADHIRIVGARENNLKEVSLRIPKNRITVFVGVSGSGKSSLVFDTIAVEAQRQLNATFPWFIQNQLPKHERPHVDAIEHLTTPVIVDQRGLAGNARSTVGTITDISSLMRVLFSRFGDPSNGPPSFYSFNDPQGMCPACEGLGQTLRVNSDLLLDKTKSLDEGAILVPGYPVGSPGRQFYAKYRRLNPAKKLNTYTAEEMHTLLHGSESTVEITFANGKTQWLKYEGLVDNFTRRYLKRDVAALSEKTREVAGRFLSEGPCFACAGSRLNPHRRSQHSRLVRHADQRPDRAARASLRSGACHRGRNDQRCPSSCGRNRARVPQSGSSDLDAVRWRGTATEAGQAPGQRPDRINLHL